MNRLFTSTILALSLSTFAVAQNSSSMSRPQSPDEVIVLSSFVDGNYNVERLLVMESGDSSNEFVMRYKVNLSKLISSYDNNSQEIEGLHSFIDSVQSDSLKSITSVDIVGYASPDGPAALNRRLADERAKDFANYVDSHYDLAAFPHTVNGMPCSWQDAQSAIESSSMPNKSEVLSIIKSGLNQAEIQSKLEAHTAAWDYIKANILPQMRSVEIHLKYNAWKVVENRTLIEEVTPEPQPSTVVIDMTTKDCDSAEDLNINCILIEMPGQELDFHNGCKRAKDKFKIRGGKAKLKERMRR